MWQHFRVDVYDDSNKQMMKQTRTVLLKRGSVDLQRSYHLGAL